MTNRIAIPSSPSANGQAVRERTVAGASSGHLILLVDDNPAVARAIGFAFEAAGHRIAVATGPEEARSLVAERRPDAILLDLNFTQGATGGEEGLACLARLMADDPGAAVVVITAHSGIRIAVAAMQAGALDFVMKPWRNADLLARVEAAIAKRRRPVPADTASDADGPGRLLGDSAPIARVRDLIRRVAPTRANVLVSGPPGSGRSLVAALLHAGAAPAGPPPVGVDARDVAAWPLMGAAGALLLRHPDRLDELDQSRLVDQLPREARLVGIVERPDRLGERLRARLGPVELVLPPLHERGEDALLLARHLARLAAGRHGRPVPLFTAAAEALILATRWPGEVRGLAQAVERAVLLGDDGVIDAAALTPRLAEAMAAVAPDNTAPDRAAPLDVSLEQSERAMIEAALRRHHHNVSHAAGALGLSRQALYRRMDRYGL